VGARDMHRPDPDRRDAHGQFFAHPGMRPLLFSWAVLLTLLFPGAGNAEPAESLQESGEASWFESNTSWGGYIKARGSASWVDDRSLYGTVDAGTHMDGVFEGRLTQRTFLTDELLFETHYEILLSGGDTTEARNELAGRFPGLLSSPGYFTPFTDDDERFLDLTHVIRDEEDYTLTHRLDRLLVDWSPGPFVLRVGRQAVTWGNGLLFNPMDLVNPFAPTDIEREYKLGDDMAGLRFSTGEGIESEVLYVPRRDVHTHEISWERSSLAAKVRMPLGELDLNILGALHYDDEVIGAGVTGYLGSAAWRADAVWTFLEDGGGKDGYLSLVANVDYSWVWGGKNLYGFLEFFYGGLGENDPAAALQSPELTERLARGELFTLGRAYLAGHARLEAHPLVNILLTVIHDFGGPSGLLQPRMVWDVTADLQAVIGGTLPYGADGTEFGGFPFPGTALLTPAPDRAFVWFTRYF